jgi:hypothetical protein
VRKTIKHKENSWCFKLIQKKQEKLKSKMNSSKLKRREERDNKKGTEESLIMEEQKTMGIRVIWTNPVLIVMEVVILAAPVVLANLVIEVIKILKIQ